MFLPSRTEVILKTVKQKYFLHRKCSFWRTQNNETIEHDDYNEITFNVDLSTEELLFLLYPFKDKYVSLCILTGIIIAGRLFLNFISWALLVPVWDSVYIPNFFRFDLFIWPCLCCCSVAILIFRIATQYLFFHS